MQLRVDKVLSQLQIAARSESKKMIRDGRVRIGARQVKNASEKFDPEKEQLYIDEQPVRYTQYQYFMLYKPMGCVTATADARDKTVMDYLPEERRRGLAPVGRLDKDTEGLLLITDDGALNHNLLAPGKHVEKTYYAKILGEVTPDMAEQFSRGIDIGEKQCTMPARLVILSSGEISEIEVTITEGKYHQIKRMFQAVGTEVLYLKRLSMGSLVLDETLQPGEYRELTPEEAERLWKPVCYNCGV
ncbi:MAG: rRNA pseudouridine synthase [Clostridiales bacterium]|nr:rRNA pseudouridine synthase [Clostridiales bacterium]